MSPGVQLVWVVEGVSGLRGHKQAIIGRLNRQVHNLPILAELSPRKSLRVLKLSFCLSEEKGAGPIVFGTWFA